MESWPPLVSGVRMSGVGAAAVWEPGAGIPHTLTGQHQPPAILLGEIILMCADVHRIKGYKS